ncbi:MAG: hypothetical protein ACK2T5_04405 [Anaerolineales bacterium]|jgi:hypothetical protein
MQQKNQFKIILVAAVLLIAIAGVWLGSATPASAQCGSQASSCKNCHEVQGEDPVNADGTSWHQSHAFGDFCYICHAGNNQATDKAEAHTGMVAPLSDIQASCMQCHPSDLEERAQVYATALGVEVGAGGESSSSGDPSSGDGQSTGSAVVAASIPSTSEIVIDDANLVDYTQRYDEIVLGQKPVNWGNLILIGLIGLLIVGGGGFVLYHEGWISITTEPIEPVPDGYSKDVVDLLPDLQHLNQRGRQGLQTILQSPDSADELLDVLGRHTQKGA